MDTEYLDDKHITSYGHHSTRMLYSQQLKKLIQIIYIHYNLYATPMVFNF